MLKLEKVSSDGISIILRNKEHFLTKPLWIAFSVAFAIHALLFLLFHIAPLAYDTSQTIFPPIRAEAESGTKEFAFADIKSPVPAIRGLPPPPTSHPYYPHTPQFLMTHPREHLTIRPSISPSFPQLEAALYEPSFQPFFKKKQKPFSLFVSGSLAELPLLTKNWKEKIPPKTSTPTCVIYSVMVEGKTGKIFWFEPPQQIHVAHAQFAEEILREMRFDMDSPIAFISGQIELHFNPGDL